MAKKAKAAPAAVAELRPSGESREVEPDATDPTKYDFSRVTNIVLARPGHGVPCDQRDCSREAIWVMRARDPHTKGSVGNGSMGVYYRPDPSAPNRVRCERHLNAGGQS